MVSPKARATIVSAAPAIFVLIWSTGYVGAKFGLPYADPMTFTALRFAIVCAILTIIASLTRAPWPREPQVWGHLAVSGLLLHTGFVGATYLALDRGVDISIAALIAGTQPLLTAMVVSPLLGEKISTKQWAGFLLGFFGLSLVVMKSFSTEALSIAEFALCVIALCGITFGALYQKRFVIGTNPWSGSAIQFGVALVPCLLWAGFMEDRHVEFNLTFILSLTWLCLALSIGAITVLMFLIRSGEASRVSSLFYLVPPMTALQGYWFFGERLSLIQLVGIGLTACGVALINMQSKGATDQTR